MAEHGDERVEGGVVGDRAVHHHERRPVPSTHTAIGVPSAERTSNRSAVSSVTLLVLIGSSVRQAEGIGGAPVELGGEHRHGVGEGVGLLGVGDVAAVGELDEAGVGQRGRQPVGDRAERGVAGVAGDHQGGDGDGGQVGGGDVERRCAQVGEADVGVGAVAVLAVLVEHRPQPRADQREEGVDGGRRAAGWPSPARCVAPARPSGLGRRRGRG